MRIRRAFVAAVLVAFATGTSAVASVWTVPGTVNAGGLNNTRFVSDLAVTNPGNVPVVATISFVPANGTTPVQITLNAGETVAYRNVLDRLWSAQGAGATQVASDAPLLIRARTYNTATSGTYGVALPVFADDRLLSPGKPADSLWISQSGDGSSGYRTNVAVVFPDVGGGAATVTIYDADGNEVGSQDFALDSAGFQQFGAGAFAGAVSVARAEVQVTRGRAAAYSVVVDNVTGDSSLFTFEDLPTGYQDVLVNGVARANGRNSTFFRTDGRFFNPTDEDAEVKVSFHAAGSSNPAPASGSFTVGAGRILDVVDVLGSLLGLPVGSAGAVRFETDAPVAILCRTSNVDPLGVKAGTYGAQQKPTPLLSLLMSADAGAVITGIRQNATFRTNVGFAAGPDGADYALTLKSAAGATVAATTASLGAFGWTQPNVQDLFPSSTIPDDATLQVRVTSGSVDVFDSSIDNASGDPVVTPIMPLPVSIPSSATIGPQGGSVRSADGRLTLKIPAGAFSAAVPVALTAEAVADAEAFGSAYALTPSTLPLAKSALLVFRASDPAPALGLVSVSLAVRTASGTFVAVGGRVDPAAGTLSVPIASTSPQASSLEAYGARGALDAGTILLPINNLSVGREKLAVLTNGSEGLFLGLVWPASAGVKPAGFKIKLSPEDRSALRVRWNHPDLGNIVQDPKNQLNATFVAPPRIPSASSIASLRVSVRGAESLVDVLASVEIVRKNWVIETDFTFNSPPCAEQINPYTVKWHNSQKVGFRILDVGSLTLTGAIYGLEKPVWALCPAYTVGDASKWYTTLTPDTDGIVDGTVELTPFSNYDFGKRGFVFEIGWTVELPGAMISGGKFPYEDFRVEPVKLPDSFSRTVPIDQENVWFPEHSILDPYSLYSYRVYSVDAP